VGEAGKLLGLQGTGGGREKKLPGSLGAVLVHCHLREPSSREYDKNISDTVIHMNCSAGVTALCKSVEKKENSAGYCSGCAGDYEDPDRSAWELDVEDKQRDTEEVRDSVEGQGWSRRVTVALDETGNSNRRHGRAVSQRVAREEHGGERRTLADATGGVAQRDVAGSTV